MRWKVEIASKPCHMQKRVVTKFALLPVITEDGEIRWLERVAVMQIYLMDPSGHWVNECFVDV